MATSLRLAGAERTARAISIEFTIAPLSYRSGQLTGLAVIMRVFSRALTALISSNITVRSSSSRDKALQQLP